LWRLFVCFPSWKVGHQNEERKIFLLKEKTKTDSDIIIDEKEKPSLSIKYLFTTLKTESPSKNKNLVHIVFLPTLIMLRSAFLITTHDVGAFFITLDLFFTAYSE
jgi:hypothetical protein